MSSPADPADVVLVDVADRVATVTMNRPDVRNAINRELRATLFDALAALDADDAVDVLILTGADPAFCAGLDLKEISETPLHDASRGVATPTPELRGPWELSKPLIGAVNGPAVTGGFELALACDFLVASERARFADTHARVGLMPGWGLTVRLPEAIGVRRSRQMSLTGNYVDAPTALAWGLVNQVVPHDELLPVCRQLAADIVSNDAAGVRRMLRTYAEGALLEPADRWDLEHRIFTDWTAAGGGQPAEIGKRRQAIIDRGRGQLG